jgi:hypothetical protein
VTVLFINPKTSLNLIVDGQLLMMKLKELLLDFLIIRWAIRELRYVVLNVVVILDMFLKERS